MTHYEKTKMNLFLILPIKTHPDLVTNNGSQRFFAVTQTAKLYLRVISSFFSFHKMLNYVNGMFMCMATKLNWILRQVI